MSETTHSTVHRVTMSLVAASIVFCSVASSHAQIGRSAELSKRQGRQSNAISAWKAQTVPSREDRWHNGKLAVGGLGFDVALDAAPRIVQRSYYDVYSWLNGARDVYAQNCYIEWGMIRGVRTGEANARAVEETWTSKRYETGSLAFTVSRLSPAMLVESSDPYVDVIAGPKFVGTFAGAPDEYLMPRHAAFMAEDGPQVADLSNRVDLNGMTQPWLLIWWGDDTNFRRTTIPNIYSRLDAWSEYVASGELYVKADMPMLLVFERRPASIAPATDALRIAFRETMGAMFVLPPFGFNHLKSSETSTWAEQFPDQVAERCATWARRMRHYPIACSEQCDAAADGSRVTIHNHFTYRSALDDWNTAGEKIAPIAPAACLAAEYGGPISLDGTPAEYAISTHSGPYTGVVGADSVSYTIRGLDRYLDQCCAASTPVNSYASQLQQELRSEVRKMIDAGPLNRAISLERKHVEKMWAHFSSVSELLIAVAEAYPFLDPELREAAQRYAVREIGYANPLTATLPTFDPDRARREYYDPVPPSLVSTVLENNLSSRQYANNNPRIGGRQEDRANSAYAFWALAYATGNWELTRSFWEGPQGIKALALSARPFHDWATLGYFGSRGDNTGLPVAIGGENRGSAYSANGQFARFIALSRLARRFDDQAAQREAIYRLARTAIRRVAQEKLIEYMYDAGIVSIDQPPDWMDIYSTAHGEGGAGQLWTSDWTDHRSDYRKVVLWDERGPLISDMLSSDWDPIQHGFMGLTPECGRFLRDHVLPEQTRLASAISRNCPAWFLVRRPSNVGKETHMDNPLNSFNTVMAMIYVLGVEGEDAAALQDMPFVARGDLYHLRRLAAALRAENGLIWQSEGDGRSSP